jgi:hypothetical protein
VFTKCYWDYGPFQGTFVKKSFFHKEEFSNEILQLVIYFIYSCHSMSHIFWKSNLSRNENLKVHRFYQILCFILKNECNFKLHHNMLKCSIFFCVCYKLQLSFKQYIHCITFTCCKRFMNFKQTLIFYKHKIEKNMKIWVLFICV